MSLRNTAKSFGEITTSQIIKTGPGYLSGLLIITDGTNAVTASLYDGVSASGTLLWEGTIPGAGMFGGGTWDTPIRFATGLYLSLSGTGGKAIPYGA